MKKLICFLLVMSFLTGCMKHDIEFIHLLKIKLESGETNVDLESLVGFDWQKVCVFYPADSYPNSAYIAYEDYRKNGMEKIPIIKKEGYSLIFLFQTSEGFRVYTSMNQPLKLHGEKHTIRVLGDGVERTGGCLNSPVSAKIDNKKTKSSGEIWSRQISFYERKDYE